MQKPERFYPYEKNRHRSAGIANSVPEIIIQLNFLPKHACIKHQISNFPRPLIFAAQF